MKLKQRIFLEPVYSTTEKLKARQFGARQPLLVQVLLQLPGQEICPKPAGCIIATTPPYGTLYNALHFPANAAQYEQALHRLKFQELFIATLTGTLNPNGTGTKGARLKSEEKFNTPLPSAPSLL